MAYLQNYLAEVKLGENPDLEKVFNDALSQVFSPQYLSKIEDTLKKRIKVKEKINKNSDVVAWVQGTTIYVNKPEFYARPAKQRVKYLLHEFMHVLNNSKSFFIINKFKEIKDLSNKLWSITKKHAKDPGKFLADRSINKSLLNNQEALSYLMNDKINWKAISSTGEQLFKQALKESGIFNLSHEFWKNRLR